MLDALVAEARLRWGLDPAPASRSSPPRGWSATPVEPSRPLLIVPLAMLRPAVADERAVAEVRPCALAGATVRPAATRWPSCAGCTRPTIPSAGSAHRTASTHRRARPQRTSRRPLYLAPDRAGAGRRRALGDALDLRPPAPARTAARGTASRPTQSLRKHLLEEAYEVYDALEGGATPELAGELGDLLLQVVLHAQLAAEAGVFDLTDVQAAIAPRSSAATRTSSATPRRGRPRTSTASGSGSRPTSAPRRARRPPPRARSTGSARRCRRSPRARRCRSEPPTSATTGRRIDGVLDKVAEEPDELREAEAADDDAAGPRSSATCCSCSSTWRASAASRPRRPCAPPTPSSGAGSAASSGRRPRAGVALRDLDFAALDALWDAAKAEEATT